MECKSLKVISKKFDLVNDFESGQFGLAKSTKRWWKLDCVLTVYGLSWIINVELCMAYSAMLL